MAYGVLAKAAGMTDISMEVGAGGINAYEAIMSSLNNKDLYNKLYELVETIQREKSLWRTYGDDPRDNEAIKLGVEYYDQL